MMLRPAPYPPIETMICEADDLYIKQIVVPKAATIIPQHSHALSHITLLASGSLNLWRDEHGPEYFAAPTPIHIPAGVKHLFQTLEDGVVMYCVHALASPEALKILAIHELL